MSVPTSVPWSWRRLLGREMLGATTLLVVLVVVFTGFGSWQFEGWQQQRAAQERDLTSRAPVPLLSVIGANDPFPGEDVGRPVSWEGTWVPDSGFLVGPRDQGGREGWWAGAIADVDGAETSVPVVVGWVPAREVPLVAGGVRVTGYLQPGEGSFATDPDPTDRVFPELRLASFTELVPVDLVSAFVVAQSLDPVPGLGQRTTPVSPDQVPTVGVSTALRNLLYALQWWILALGALVVWGRFVRDRLRRPQGRFAT